MTEGERKPLTAKDLIVQNGPRSSVVGVGEYFNTRTEVAEGPPPLYVLRGHEIKYHCHVYTIIKNEDTGILLTMVKDDI